MISRTPQRILNVLIILPLVTGCASTLRTSPMYPSAIKQIKTIAVMPPNIEVYKLTAGGVRELIDEWSDESKKLIEKSLKIHLS